MKITKWKSIYKESNKNEYQMYLEGDSGKCPAGGCIQKRGNKWRIYSAKDGHVWPQEYDTKETAENALKAYHVHH